LTNSNNFINVSEVWKYKIAYSTNAYTKVSIKEAISCIKKIGFEGVEILADEPHLFANNVKDKELSQLSNQLKREGLAISNVNANTAQGLGTIIDTANSKRKERVEYIKKCIDIARKLGAENISISSGKSNEGISKKEVDDALFDSLNQILSYAERFNIKVGIECEPEFYLDTVPKILKIFTKFKSPILGANLDIGHSWVMKENIRHILTHLDKKIFNIHIEDIKARRHFHLIPGEGDINFKKIKSYLDEIRYDKFLTLELYTYSNNPSSAGKKGLQYLRNVFT